MSFKVLITCPPMINQINVFEKLFHDANIEVTIPEIKQTLTEKEIIDILPEHDGWIIGDDPATSKVFKAGKSGRLKAAVKWGIGVDNVDFDACRRLNIPITNTPGMFGSEVADLAMCYILGLARDAFYIDRLVRQGKWPKPAGISLKNKTIGIVGLGDIGSSIAKRCHAHEMQIIGWDPKPKFVNDYILLRSDWPEGVEDRDFIVFACALNDSTYHMFNDNLLKKIKTGVRLVNISRGNLINESSLINGLKNKKIHSAALDVFENEPLNSNSEILRYEKCILGSHNGSNTLEAVTRASHKSIGILIDMLNNNYKSV